MLSSDNDVYFANKEAKETAGILLDKGQSFFNLLQSNAYLSKLNHMWRAYHGAYHNDLGFGHRIDFMGEQGELVSLPVNHFRNLAQHIYVMITSNRPVMEARAVNSDYKSAAQTIIANGVLDYYMREKQLETALKKACEMAIVLGAAYIKLEWNATSGEIFDVDDETGMPIYEGEVEFSNYSPLDVVFDGTKESWDNEWLMVRSFKNRFDLMAKYPEFADKIKTMPTKTDNQVYRLAVWSNDDTDDIPVYEFFHKRTEAVPEGRYLLFVDADVVLLDSKMPYRVLPVFRIAPHDILGTPYGYSPMFDVFPIQEAINSTYSSILTNQNAFAVQNVFVERGADINLTSLEGALNIIEGNKKPEPLQLAATPQEVFNFLNILIQSAETISGVNSVARGNPEASLKSGTALALVQSMALQFVSGLQQSYVKLIEDVGTALIQILKDFAMTPKVVALVGKNNKMYLKEFTGDKISAINRVVVDVGNPLSKTIAGRVQMAEQMLQMKLIKNPQEYDQVITTGRLDSMYEGDLNELLLIKQENEKMLEGEHVMALAIDAHKLHIVEHKALLSDPDLRQDANLMQNALSHIQEHVQLLRNTDPDLLMLIGEQPLQNPQAQAAGVPGMPPMPGAPPPTNAPSNVMTGPQPPGNMIQGAQANQAVANMLPNLPRPPGPFKNAPVTPQELVPPVKG